MHSLEEAIAMWLRQRYSIVRIPNQISVGQKQNLDAIYTKASVCRSSWHFLEQLVKCK
ncbi:hypothetical protein ACF3DV_28605 [Chlorogloeopsis fritschii PCC 9212]|uniref:hypothetical protein n=1 Tax=Chlorogloeopsis fritschii TaxID=1124 RepID=UPI0002DEC6CF|nr:hypothetical protein [Chlorogloeopsis fritschii]